MTKHLFFLLLFITLFSNFLVTTAQPLTQEEAVESAVDHAVTFYKRSLGRQSRLYNGTEYVDYDRRIDGHQFFESEDWEDGTIRYDGEVYHNVGMLYDITTDKIIIGHFDQGGYYNRIQLLNEKMQGFTVHGHTFVRLLGDSIAEGSIRTAFYDLLYDGEVKVWARRVKTIQEKSAATRLEEEFQQRNKYYIFKNGSYNQVRGKGSVLSVFADKKKALKKALRENPVSFRDTREYAIVQAAKQYDELGN
jgi:hypothetical protein